MAERAGRGERKGSSVIPEDVRRYIADMAEGAIVNAEGGFGGGELQWAIEGLAEGLTSLCKDFGIFYRTVNYIEIPNDDGGLEEIEFTIWSNEQWPIWEKK